MMIFPNVTCNKAKLLHNINYLADALHCKGRVFAAVVKGFCADDEIMKILENSECDWFADSRIEDLKKLNTIKQRFLIRLSQMCEIEDVISSSEVSFESEPTTIKELQNEALKQNVRHGIVIAVDMGDLREGCFFKDLQDIDLVVETVLQSPNLDLLGIGTNLGCFGGVLTDADNMSELIDIADYIERKYHIKLKYISGMTSGAYGMLSNNTMPLRINHGRFGEIWLLGYDSVSSIRYDEFYDDAFVFSAQIIEIKFKPTKPIGTIGGNAFGEHIVREDYGMITRGLLAFGTQDVDYEYLIPVDDGIKVLGASSDHTIIEISDKLKYRIGDIVQFKLKYHSLLRIYTSKYVKKYVI